MSRRALPANGRLPEWLVIVASVAIIFHLSAVAVVALTYISGPWPTGEGIQQIGPPKFAVALFDSVPGEYAKALQMLRGEQYHFSSNRPGGPSVTLEVRLKDEAGRTLETVTVPDPGANFWVRHRQKLLARALGIDVPVMPPQMEKAPAPGTRDTTVQVWKDVPNTPNRMVLDKMPEHLIPRDRPTIRPSDLSMLFAHAYARHLCRSHGAAKAEVIRLHQDQIPPDILFMEQAPQGAFEKVQSNFGELSK
jgi:hypothetical protein